MKIRLLLLECGSSNPLSKHVESQRNFCGKQKKKKKGKNWFLGNQNIQNAILE